MVLSGGPTSILKKYTTQPRGFWRKVWQFFALVPNRSTGNPLVQYYREPTPFSRPETKYYTDPETLPRSDIADNPYWKRDVRRNYSKTSFYDQGTIAGLLTLGSQAAPRIADGEKGTSQLTTVQDSGSKGLVTAFSDVANRKAVVDRILTPQGLPPLPPSAQRQHWKLLADESQGAMYNSQYPCRTFT